MIETIVVKYQCNGSKQLVPLWCYVIQVNNVIVNLSGSVNDFHMLSLPLCNMANSCFMLISRPCILPCHDYCFLLFTQSYV